MEKVVRVQLFNCFLIGAFLAGLVYFFGDTFASIHEHWTQVSSNYSHGYLLLFVSLYLLYEERAELLSFSDLRFTHLFLFLLLVSSFVWMLAELVQVQIIQQLALLPIVYFFICSVFGLKGAKIAAFPVALIILAIPIWSYLIEVLQHLTVVACSFWLSLLDIPVNIDKYYINLPAGSLYVAGSCSGLSYFLTAVSLGAVQAQFNYYRLSRKVLLVVIAGLFGLVSNWVRVFSLVVVAHETEMKSSLIQDHFWHGWIIFALSLVPLYWISKKLQDEHPDTSLQSTAIIELKPVNILVLGLALLIAFSGPLLVKALSVTNKTISIEPLPEFIADYKFEKSSQSGWAPNYSNSDSIISGMLYKGEEAINFYAYSYFSQTQGKELIYYTNTIGNDEWRELDSEIDYGGVFSVQKTRLVSRTGKRKKIVLSWYQVAGRATSNHLKAKIFQLAGRLSSRQDAVLLAISADCDIRCDDEEYVLSKLVEPLDEMYMSLIRYE